jgi:hypothetical protein
VQQRAVRRGQKLPVELMQPMILADQAGGKSGQNAANQDRGHRRRPVAPYAEQVAAQADHKPAGEPDQAVPGICCDERRRLRVNHVS